jgi:hypothetical protein
MNINARIMKSILILGILIILFKFNINKGTRYKARRNKIINFGIIIESLLIKGEIIRVTIVAEVSIFVSTGLFVLTAT